MRFFPVVILPFFLSIIGCSPTLEQQHKLSVVETRAHQNMEMTQPGSPLMEEDQNNFGGLKYFPVDPSFKLEAELTPFQKPEIINLKQGDSLEKKLIKFAKVHFEFNGKSSQLIVYKYMNDPLAAAKSYDDELFVPFFDLTSGAATYDGGRYIYPTLNSEGKVVLDFNLATNPYCAYNPKYSCVVPPIENSLDFEVNAGEKSFKAH